MTIAVVGLRVLVARGARLCLAACACASVAACGPQGIAFYDVLRERTEQCSIRSNGEFCVEPEQFAPPLVEAWAIDQRDDAHVLYVGEETWVLAPLPDDADPWTAPRTARREQVVTAGAALCTTTEVESVEFVADGQTLTGSFSGTTRLEGPTACGATPVGERFLEALTGNVGTP